MEATKMQGAKVIEVCYETSRAVIKFESEPPEIGSFVILHPVTGMTEWQPIETAPKDGTVVMIYVQRDRNASVWAAYWYSGNDRSFGDEEYPWVILDPTEDGQLNAWTADRVTHWMPLPAPPVLSPTGKEEE